MLSLLVSEVIMEESLKTLSLDRFAMIEELRQNFLYLRHLNKMELWKGRIE